jgi:predicted site-specific integrase-resolvase
MSWRIFDHDEKSAAMVLGVSTRTLARYRRSGLISHYLLPGGRVRYSTEQLAEFMAASRVVSEHVRKCPRLS